MAIIDDLMELYSNDWEASFDYNGQQCWVFPKSVNDIIVVIGEKEYQATSFGELISLEVDETTLIAIMDGLEVQYY